MNIYREISTHIRSFPTTFWVVIAATLMNQAGNMALVFLIVYLHEALKFSLGYASFGFATFSSCMLISGIVGGGIIDRFGPARVIVCSLFANGLVLMTFPFLHQYIIVLIACMCWGFCFGLYRPASQTLVSHLSLPGLHKITFSVYRLAINLGMSIGPAVGGYLAYHSFSAIFFANGIANILAVTIFFFGLFKTPWFYSTVESTKKGLSLKWLKYDMALRVFVLGMVPVSIVFFQHESTLAVFLSQNLGFSLGFYGILFTINTLLIVFCELPLNVATINWTYRTNFVLGSFFITMGFAGLLFATKEWHVILLTISWTIGEMILYPAASSYITEIAPENVRGTYMSLFATASNTGMLIGPFGGALIMERFGAHGLWFACGVMGVISMSIYYWFLPAPSPPTLS